MRRAMLCVMHAFAQQHTWERQLWHDVNTADVIKAAAARRAQASKLWGGRRGRLLKKCPFWCGPEEEGEIGSNLSSRPRPTSVQFDWGHVIVPRGNPHPPPPPCNNNPPLHIAHCTCAVAFRLSSAALWLQVVICCALVRQACELLAV